MNILVTPASVIAIGVQTLDVGYKYIQSCIYYLYIPSIHYIYYEWIMICMYIYVQNNFVSYQKQK